MAKMGVLDFNVMREEVSKENVLAMSECIAFMETRHLVIYMGTRMQRICNELLVDILHKDDVDHVFSDGYDLVQECALFLCEHYGEHLSDTLYYTKKGKKITVQIAAIKRMMKIINRKTSNYYRSVSLEALTPASEPSVEMPEETEQDYTVADNIVEHLNLTDEMKTALECRMSGLSYPEIGRILARAQSTVFGYFVKMRQRYATIYG